MSPLQGDKEATLSGHCSGRLNSLACLLITPPSRPPSFSSPSFLPSKFPLSVFSFPVPPFLFTPPIFPPLPSFFPSTFSHTLSLSVPPLLLSLHLPTCSLSSSLFSLHPIFTSSSFSVIISVFLLSFLPLLSLLTLLLFSFSYFLLFPPFVYLSQCSSPFISSIRSFLQHPNPIRTFPIFPFLFFLLPTHYRGCSCFSHFPHLPSPFLPLPPSVYTVIPSCAHPPFHRSRPASCHYLNMTRKTRMSPR